jgi:hypothetical protein
MGKVLFYGSAGTGIAMFLIGWRIASAVAADCGLLLLTLCLILALMSKEA